MTSSTIADRLRQIDDVRAKDVEGSHVCQIWEDGEVTMTKAGSLYGQRRCSVISVGTGLSLPFDMFPHRNDKHGYIFCSFDDYEDKLKIVLALIDEYHDNIFSDRMS
jgi:hypothetical protein